MIFDAEHIIARFYPEDTPLRRLLLLHSRQVMEKAVEIAEQAEIETDL